MNTVLFLFKAANPQKALRVKPHHARCCLDNMKQAFKGLLSRQTDQSSLIAINGFIHHTDKRYNNNKHHKHLWYGHGKSARCYKCSVCIST